LQEKKNLMTARVSMLLKSSASPDMLPFSPCNKKRLATAHEQIPLSNDTIESVLRHREVGRAKDLSAPPRKWFEGLLSLRLRSSNLEKEADFRSGSCSSPQRNKFRGTLLVPTDRTIRPYRTSEY